MVRPSKRRGRGSAQERARKAFARRQRARRWLTWRYVVALVLAVSLVGLACYALYFSSWLRTEGVEVVGNDQLTDRRVLAVAEVETGGPLATVDLERIEKRLERVEPTVKSADVSRKWPHHVRIEIVERTPVAVLDRGDTLKKLDSAGVPFGSLRRAPDDLPRVKVGPEADDDALQEGAKVVAALDPEVAALVGHVEVRTVDQILLHLRDGREVRWGSAEQSGDKARVLLALLDRDARVYDVSVPGQPTTR
ncbi:cell division protein FtsQ/DivIB [Nocardioides sp. SYSU DS0651]|uniref:cell division protein FtsQ/DivIB n=1 Tax=Nocardioides sp. SYSU DS0651 TaxID=3415955 RepID=UPI003F4C0FE9